MIDSYSRINWSFLELISCQNNAQELTIERNTERTFVHVQIKSQHACISDQLIHLHATNIVASVLNNFLVDSVPERAVCEFAMRRNIFLRDNSYFQCALGSFIDADFPVMTSRIHRNSASDISEFIGNLTEVAVFPLI
jgi:hypothetical protein